jgi:hypothetical protein
MFATGSCSTAVPQMFPEINESFPECLPRVVVGLLFPNLPRMFATGSCWTAVPQTFPKCSLNVPGMFAAGSYWTANPRTFHECSPNVPRTFHECSLNVPQMFHECATLLSRPRCASIHPSGDHESTPAVLESAPPMCKFLAGAGEGSGAASGGALEPQLPAGGKKSARIIPKQKSSHFLEFVVEKETLRGTKLTIYTILPVRRGLNLTYHSRSWTGSNKWRFDSAKLQPRPRDPNGWYPLLVTALGRWGKRVPRGQVHSICV